ncbi:MAG: OadG family protein [Desulfurococcaceae archaeon TW002]
MTSLSEGLLPAILGLLNAFLILTIVVVILYLYKWLVVKKRTRIPTPTPEIEEKLVIEEKPKEKETLTTQEVAAAVAAVKHHIKSTLRRGVGFSEAFKPSSLWVLNWLSEATQTLDHNPYMNLRSRE